MAVSSVLWLVTATLFLADVNGAIRCRVQSRSVTRYTSADANDLPVNQVLPDVSAQDILDKNKEVVDDIEKLLNAIALVSGGSAAPYVKLLKEGLSAVQKVFNLIAGFIFPPKTDPVMALLEKSFSQLNLKLDQLFDKASDFPVILGLNNVEQAVTTFKQTMTKLHNAMDIWFVDSSNAMNNETYNSTINQFEQACNKHDPVDALTDLCVALTESRIPGIIVKGSEYDYRKITAMTKDLLTNLASFTIPYYACRNLADGYQDPRYDKVDETVFSMLDDLSNMTKQVEEVERAEFFLNHRLFKETPVTDAMSSISLNEAAGKIYQFFNAKYPFVDWFVHVYEGCEGYDKHALDCLADVANISCDHNYRNPAWGRNLAISWTDNRLPTVKASQVDATVSKFQCSQTKDLKGCMDELRLAVQGKSGPDEGSMIQMWSNKIAGTPVYGESSYTVHQQGSLTAAVSLRQDPLLAAGTKYQHDTSAGSNVRPEELMMLLLTLLLVF